jgi:hypothetical protein
MMAPITYLDTLMRSFTTFIVDSLKFRPDRYNLCVQIVRPSTYGRAANDLPERGRCAR